MKHFLYTVALAVFFFSSCSLREDVTNEDIHHTRSRVRTNHVDYESVIYNNERTLSFANDSVVDAVLVSLSEMSYSELRSWYNAAGYVNPIIESHIVYDSLYEALIINSGIVFPEDETEQDDSNAFQLLYDIITQNHPELFHFVITENGNGEYETTCELLGELDEEALTNSNEHIYIVGEEIHKVEEDSHVIYTESQYEEYGGLPIEELELLILSYTEDEETISNDAEEEDLIPDLPTIVYYDYEHYRNEILSKGFKNTYYSENRVYKMQVSLEAVAYYSWFYGYTKCYTQLEVINYKKSIGTYWRTSFPTDINYQYLYEAYSPGHYNDLQEFGNNSLGEQDKKHITHKREICTYVFRAFPNPTCGFISYSVDATNYRVTMGETFN